MSLTKAAAGGAGCIAVAAAGAVAFIVFTGLALALLLPTDEDEDTLAASGQTCTVTAEDNTGIPDQYVDLVEEAAETSGFSVEIHAAQIEQESGWDETARSRVGAQGIAQLMPDTAESLGVDDPDDPDQAIPALGEYMAQVREAVEPYADSEGEEVELALAAYNAGPGAVEQHEGIPPYNETRDYVNTITDAAQGEFTSDCARTGAVIGDIGDGDWQNPLPGGDVTSPYGMRPCPGAATNCPAERNMHHGLDLSTGGGTDIVAPTDMQVGDAFYDDIGGYMIVGRQLEDGEYDESEGFVFQFGHCEEDSFYVGAGDKVASGEPLCVEGTTGMSTGEHLHFQISEPDAPDDVYSNSHSMDPEPILKEAGVM